MSEEDVPGPVCLSLTHVLSAFSFDESDCHTHFALEGQMWPSTDRGRKGPNNMGRRSMLRI